MNLETTRNAALGTSLAMFLTSSVLLLTSFELPAPLVIIPFALVFAFAVTACVALIRNDPYSTFPLFFTGKCLREYAREQPGDKLFGAAAIWIGSWLYGVALMSRVDSSSACDGVCGMHSTVLAAILGVCGMLTFGAAVLLDAGVFWQIRRRERYHP